MSSSATAPLTAWPEADARAGSCLEAAVEGARSRLGGALRAVVLGGSLARGEGLAVDEPEGLRLISDLDLYLVVDDPAEPSVVQSVASLRAELEDDPFLAAPVDLAAVGPRWFDGLGGTLPARQLARGARILYRSGADFSPPRTEDAPSPRGVDPDDALKLLHNRYAEHLLLGWRAARRPAHPFALHHRWKVLVDAPLAWLAAEGLYDPGRPEQILRLQEGTARLPGRAREWLEEVVVTLRQIQEAQATGLVSGELLRRVGWEGVSFAAGTRGEEAARRRAAEAREPLVRRTWPFHRALLAARIRGRALGWAGLAEAVEGGAPGDGDLEQGLRWLRREPLLARLRESRRWHGLAPRPLRSWWAYGWGGVGPERVYLAAALRFASVPRWDEPLRGVLRETLGFTPVPRDPARAEAWIGGFWSGWIMGGGRA